MIELNIIYSFLLSLFANILYRCWGGNGGWLGKGYFAFAQYKIFEENKNAKNKKQNYGYFDCGISNKFNYMFNDINAGH